MMKTTIAAALALMFLPAAAPAQAADPAGTVLEVSAEGRTTRVPDVAVIRAGVVAQAPTAAVALADDSVRMNRVVAALTRAGVAPRDVQTARVSLSPQYRYADGQPPAITGYQATNSVQVRFRAIDRAGAILDALVGEGANQIDGPSLQLDDPDAALDEARADAVRRARARATLYADAAGLKVARILRIAEAGESDSSRPQPLMFARAAAPKATPLASGETAVTATLSVRFLLQ